MSFYPDPKIKTARSKEYRFWIAEQPCEACRREATPEEPNVAAHTTGRKGTSLKASDFTCLSLCWFCHEEQERIGHVTFAEKHNLDYTAIRLRLMERYILEMMS